MCFFLEMYQQVHSRIPYSALGETLAIPQRVFRSSYPQYVGENIGELHTREMRYIDQIFVSFCMDFYTPTP
jgi:hypothetical protein